LTHQAPMRSIVAVGRSMQDRLLRAIFSSKSGKLHDLILGLLVHMVVVGLPISFSVRRFAK
jgi:hypothetical protein